MDMNSLYVVRTTNEQILAEYSLPPFRRSVRGSNFIPGEITWLDGLPAIPLENLIFATSMPDYSVLLLILKGGTWNKVEPIAISFFPRGCVSLAVADPGKGPGVLGLPLIFRPNWGPTWSPLISGSGWPPPVPPYLKAWIRHCLVQLKGNSTSNVAFGGKRLTLSQFFVWYLAWQNYWIIEEDKEKTQEKVRIIE